MTWFEIRLESEHGKRSADKQEERNLKEEVEYLIIMYIFASDQKLFRFSPSHIDMNPVYER